MEKKELTGKVVVETFSEGSKSEHAAVYLVVGRKKYKLKRKGGNPFFDEDLMKLEGKRIRATGTLNPYYFIIEGELEILPEVTKSRKKPQKDE